MSVSGRAAQFTATKARALRELAACSARARHSLPEPVGPWMSIGSVEFATREALRMMAAMYVSLPASSSRERTRAGPRDGAARVRTAPCAETPCVETPCEEPVRVDALCVGAL